MAINPLLAEQEESKDDLILSTTSAIVRDTEERNDTLPQSEEIQEQEESIDKEDAFNSKLQSVVKEMGSLKHANEDRLKASENLFREFIESDEESLEEFRGMESLEQLKIMREFEQGLQKKYPESFAYRKERVVRDGDGIKITPLEHTKFGTPETDRSHKKTYPMYDRITELTYEMGKDAIIDDLSIIEGDTPEEVLEGRRVALMDNLKVIGMMLPIAREREDKELVKEYEDALTDILADEDNLDLLGMPRDTFLKGLNIHEFGRSGGTIITKRSLLGSENLFRERFAEGFNPFSQTDERRLRKLESEIQDREEQGLDTAALEEEWTQINFRKEALELLNPKADSLGRTAGAMASYLAASAAAGSILARLGLGVVSGATTGARIAGGAALAGTEFGLGVLYGEELPGIIPDWVMGLPPESTASKVITGAESALLATLFNVGIDAVRAIRGKKSSDAVLMLMEGSPRERLADILSTQGNIHPKWKEKIIERLKELGVSDKEMYQLIRKHNENKLVVEADRVVPQDGRTIALKEIDDAKGLNTEPTKKDWIQETIENNLTEPLPVERPIVTDTSPQSASVREGSSLESSRVRQTSKLESVVGNEDALVEFDGKVGRLVLDDERNILLRRTGEIDIEIPNTGKDLSKTLRDVEIRPYRENDLALPKENPEKAFIFNEDGTIKALELERKSSKGNVLISEPNAVSRLANRLIDEEVMEAIQAGREVVIPKPQANTVAERAYNDLEAISGGLREEAARVTDALDLGESVLPRSQRFVGGTKEFQSVARTELTPELLNTAKEQYNSVLEGIEQSRNIPEETKNVYRNWIGSEIERIDRYAEGELFKEGIGVAGKDALTRLKSSRAYKSSEWKPIREAVEEANLGKLNEEQLRMVADEAGIDISDADRLFPDRTEPQMYLDVYGDAVPLRNVEGAAPKSGEITAPKSSVEKVEEAIPSASKKLRDAEPKTQIRDAEGGVIGETVSSKDIDLSLSVNTDEGIFDIRARMLDDPDVLRNPKVFEQSGHAPDELIQELVGIDDFLGFADNSDWLVVRGMGKVFSFLFRGNTLNRPIRRLLEHFTGGMKVELMKFTESSRDLKNALSEAGIKTGTRKMGDVLSDISSYFHGLQGEDALTSIPEAARRHVVEMKEQRMRLSYHIAQSEAERGTQMFDTIMSNLDSYLARTYRIDVDKTWTLDYVKRYRPEVYERARDWIKHHWNAKYKAGDYNAYLKEVQEIQEKIAKREAENVARIDRGQEPLKDLKTQSDEALRKKYNLEPLEEWTDAQADNIILDMFDKRKGGFRRFLAEDGTIGAQDVTSLMSRGDVPIELRELWGEITNPLEAMERTIQRQVSLIYNRKAQEALREELIRSGLAEVVAPNSVPQGEGLVRLGSSGDPSKFDVLSDLYVSKELRSSLRGISTAGDGVSYTSILRAFEGVYEGEGGIADKILKAYRKAVGVAKYQKTLLNPEGYISNFYGAVLNELQTGNFSVKNFLSGIESTLERNGYYNMSNTAKREYLREIGHKLQQYGLLEQNVVLQDVVSHFRAGADQIKPMFSAGVSSINEVRKKGMDVLASMWGGTDDAMKVAAWMNESAQYAKAGYSGADLDRKVAQVVSATRQNYSRTPWIMRKLSQHDAILSPFINFYYDQGRIMLNNPMIATQDIIEGLRLGNKELVKIGVRRLVSSSTIGVLSPFFVSRTLRKIAPALYDKSLSTDDEDYDLLNPFLAPWDRNQGRTILSFDKKGNATYANLSYVMPNVVYLSLVEEVYNALDRGQDPLEALYLNIMGNVANSGIAWKNILGAIINEDIERNKPLTSEGQTLPERVAGRVSHATVPLREPGVYNLMDRVLKTMSEDSNVPGGYGAIYPKGNLGWRALGVRAQSFNVKKNYSDNIRSSKRSISSLTNEYRSHIQQRMRNGEAYDDLLKAHERGLTSIYIDLIEMVQARKRLGDKYFGEGETGSKAKKELREAGFSNREIRAIARGEIPEIADLRADMEERQLRRERRQERELRNLDIR